MAKTVTRVNRTMPTTTDQANLARIRDNQRRSRARRKEYVQELENRVRTYETRGVEASAEIQQAARKVAEENRRLRSLLNQHGVTDDHIDAFLVSGIVTPAHPLANMAQYRTGTPGHDYQALQELMMLNHQPTYILPANASSPHEQQQQQQQQTLSDISAGSPVWDSIMPSPVPSPGDESQYTTTTALAGSMAPSLRYDSPGSISSSSPQLSTYALGGQSLNPVQEVVHRVCRHPSFSHSPAPSEMLYCPAVSPFAHHHSSQPPPPPYMPAASFQTPAGVPFGHEYSARLVEVQAAQ